jgi:PilZ domain-containing protein
MNSNRRTKANVDRRMKFRKVPEKFAFIQLERDDGGAVLNISEGGLSFSTFAPIEQKGPIHFWFSLNLSERIDAWGEVTWTDKTKKVGGLRFIRLPERAGRQIREWISEPVSPQLADGKPATPEEAGRPSQVAASKPDAVARFVSKAHSGRSLIFANSILSGSDDLGDSTAPPDTLREVEAKGELVPMQRHLSEKRRQFRRGLLLGIGISVAIVVPAMKYWSYRHENRGFVKTSAELPARTSASALPSTPIQPTAPSASIDIFRSGNQNNGIAKGHAPSTPATETGGHSSLHALGAPLTSPSARAPLGPVLNGNASRQKPAMTPQQLWALVQAGNSKAAVALAELYIKGEGVSQNCNQARVLLLVASEKRNPEAIKRLHELDKTDCP